MSTKITIGALVYLNSQVYDRRIDYVKQSLQTFGLLCQTDTKLVIINNGGGVLAENVIRQEVQGEYDLINLPENFYDVAVHIGSLVQALKNDSPYVVYTYDDFVHYDSDWATDAVKYMDENPGIDCIRLTKYEYDNRRAYDKAYTSTYVNPDSCRHTPGPGKKPLQYSAPSVIGAHTFYACNWYPNSRPTMWRTKALAEAIGDISKPIPVMQTFENRLSVYAERKHETWLSGFLDMGMCHTFPISTSERTKSPNFCDYVTIDAQRLMNLCLESGNNNEK